MLPHPHAKYTKSTNYGLETENKRNSSPWNVFSFAFAICDLACPIFFLFLHELPMLSLLTI